MLVGPLPNPTGIQWLSSHQREVIHRRDQDETVLAIAHTEER